ncbi:MAG: amylo-alpha-1,6-glucosidase [Anaerolineae bacterium]
MFTSNSTFSTVPFLELLRNHIDITRVPFSDRGSRLLIYQTPGESELYIKLAERLADLEPGIDAYMRRPPFIRDIVFIDEKGEPLEFEITSAPEVMRFRTRVGEFGLVFQEPRILAFGLPPNSVAGVRFHVMPEFRVQTESGGELKGIRNLGYSTNGELIVNRITPEKDGYTVECIVRAGDDSAISIHVSSKNNVHHETAPFSQSCAGAAARWQKWFSHVPPVAEPFRRTYAYAWWVMANNLVSPLGNVAYESMMPSKITYIGLWLWDSALHTLAFRHIDPDLARNQFRAMLAYQFPTGKLPDAIHDEGVISEIDHPLQAEVTKPPILAWAALKLHESAPDIEFLREVYIPLVRLNAWWFSMNDDDGDGLVQYNHPYSSGLDDNPLWDYGMPVESPDINTYLCVQMDALAVMAQALGLENEAAMWRRRAESMARRMMEDFWDEETGIFRALLNEEPIPVVTPFNLYPLWTGRLSDRVRDRLIAHLTDPDEFWGKYVLPTVARNDPHYDPETMWRGPIWANVNYFFIEALKKVGRDDLARELRDKTLELVMSQPGIFEYYSAETGAPPLRAASIFGWTAAIFIDLALEATAEMNSRAQQFPR